MIYNSAPIDEQLLAELAQHDVAAVQIQTAGFVRQILDPESRKATLANEPAPDKPLQRFTVDTVNYDVQLAHVLNGGVPIAPAQRWGSRTENRYDLRMTLLVATTRPDLLPVILRGLSDVQDLQVTEFSANTLAVLQREFLFVPDREKPYNPRLCAYAIRYTRVNAELQTTH